MITLKRINKILTILTICTTFSCGAPPIKYRYTRKFNSLHQDMVAHTEEFYRLAKDKGFRHVTNYRLTGGFGEIGRDGAVGVCFSFYDASREIELDALYWKSISDLRRKMLMFHELTHCLCNRGHDHSEGSYKDSKNETYPDANWTESDYKSRGYFEDGCSTSIMHPRLQGDWCLTEHLDHYINEMLEGCSG